MIMKHELSSLAAAFVLTISTTPTSLGVPPPHVLPSPPVGYEEWQKTGLLPNKLFLPSGYERNHQGVIISTPNREYLRRDRSGDGLVPNVGEPEFPGFSVKNNPAASNRRWLVISGSDQRPTSKSLCAAWRYAFDIGDNDVIPLYDQLYSAKCLPSELVLSRVTDQIPAELRPRLDTRTISTVALDTFLFCDQHPIYKGREDLYEITIDFQKATNKVLAKLKPLVGLSGDVPPLEGQPPKLPARPPLELEIVKDGLLTACGRSYKVLNVVPPQDIEGVGHLVGWIELAADPVEPAP